MTHRKWRLVTESENFKKGHFQNLSETPVMGKEVTFRRILSDYFRRPASTAPATRLPSVIADLKASRAEKPVITWFGHSSYLIQSKEINILVDPVFSGHASPLSSMIKAFPGSNVYSSDDMPVIDIMVITHNHYDHMDTSTLRKMKDKTRQYVTPIGVGRQVARYVTADPLITELDWWETAEILPDINLTAAPARHFSGRGIKRAGSLWASFVVEIYGYRIYIGGDSGYDKHFKTVGDQYGPFDIAMLECGQYNTLWPNIHMMPEETVQASIDLKAKVLMPVHWGKFTLANHAWNEPVRRASLAAQAKGVQLTTPMIGEPVILDTSYPKSIWWNI